MKARDRFLTTLRNGVPDRVPAAPDISNYIPCKRTGRPFWEIYFYGEIPLWRAYLDAASYYGIDAWMASCTGAPFVREETPVEREITDYSSPDREALHRFCEFKTPAGKLTSVSTCLRYEPPSPTEKPIKDLTTDLAAFHWLRPRAVAIDMAVFEEMRAACKKLDQAFGVTIGYPGFQSWMNVVDGGVAPLCYAETDTPEILEGWLEHDLDLGTEEMQLLVAARPDYILFGGSGTITLASPALARKYALPALKKWSAMAKAAGIPTHLHSCGKSRVLVDMLAEETDINSINPLEPAPMGDVDLAEVKRARGQQIGLMGNLHTTSVMLHGSPAEVRAAAIDAMRAAGTGGGFILSTGDQCGRETPDANLFALVEAAREFGVYDQRDGTLPALN